jgi:putative oxidoreductase
MTTLFSSPSLTTMPQAPAASRGRVALVALWVVQVAVAGMFLLAGGLKLAGLPAMVALFDAIGVGQWFRYVTGSIEVVSALALLVPSLAPFGALLLIPTMVGAIATHLFIVGGSPMDATVLLAGSLAIAWARRGQLVSAWSRLH